MSAKQLLTRSIITLAVFLLVAGLGATPVAGSAAEVPESLCDNTTPVRWDVNGHWYLAVCANRITWEEANTAAIDQGGHLVTLY